MGKRGRTRTREGAQPETAPAARRARRERPEPVAGTGLNQANKTLAAYLGGAFALALVVILGISLLGGVLGPILVALFAIAFAVLLHRWSLAGLDGLVLSDQDRLVQTMAGGLLILCVTLAVVAAVVLTVA